ncbi:ATP-binding protein [Verrucomicrobium sp. BvORR034]|uniref:ATP-binding protein n=1 Tax=Verrucomicrobium sp. BvORR034 TaxID=1396418 RepID=UPI0009DE1B0E|nr:ATP-binding protein [Verrucomicrobium sp. BvORR034]
MSDTTHGPAPFASGGPDPPPMLPPAAPALSAAMTAGRILLLAPTSNDARLTAGFLSAAGLDAFICHNIEGLSEAMRVGCAAVLVAEEALHTESVSLLVQELHAQPSWSDLPILILTGNGEATRYRQRYLDLLGPVGNVSIMERPVRPTTLVNSCKVALRSRLRQYQVRDLLEERQAVVASISDAFVTFDTSWRCTFLNEKVEVLAGRKKEELIGRCIWDVFPEARELPIYQAVQFAMLQQQNMDFEQHHATLNRWLEVRIYPSTRGISVFISDITDRRHAQDELRESKARLEFALNAAQMGDWDFNLADNTSHRSLRHDQAFGYTEPVKEWGLETFIEHVHPGDREAVSRKFFAAIMSNESWRFECRVVWPDGCVHWIAMHGGLYHDASGRFPRMIGTVMDITARKDAEVALLQQTEALREADRKKDEFLAMLSHELRNPLAAVSHAATLVKGACEPEDLHWAAGVIDRQTRQLAHLIDDLLDVSRITTGKIHLRKEVIDVAVILDRACESAGPLVRDRGHHLARHYSPGELWLEADATRIEQVVLNLLTNAAKYTPNGGQIELTAEKQGREVVIQVRDNGTGIVPERMPEMFQLFTQGERSIARSEGGLGIGLTIVQKIAEMHGGRVEAESPGPQQGSTFTVHLPMADTPAPATMKQPAPASAEPPAQRILVVDDNVHSAQGLARLLERAGHQTTVAHDGTRALSIAEKWAPHAVVLDIGLPGMDGYEVARRMRDLEGCRNALIIAVTGYGQEEDRQRSHDAGFDHHLVKPVGIAELRALLGQATRQPNGKHAM